MEVWAGQADPLDAPDRHVALADQPGHHLAGLPPPRLQERWGFAALSASVDNVFCREESQGGGLLQTGEYFQC